MKTRLAAGLLALFLAACGGGGGGDGGNPGSGVVVSLVSPPNITEEVYEGTFMRTITLVGTATGNVSSLSGRPLYIIVVDPDGLFQPTPSVQVGPGNQVSVILAGAVQPVPRHVTGNLTIHACLDAACTQPLGGSPLHLAYDVTVRAGLNVDTTPIDMAYRFGDAPTIRSFPVALPANLTNFTAAAVGDDGYSINNYARAEVMQTGSDGLVTVTFAPTIPGVYTGKVRVDATVAGSAGAMAFRKDIPFTYTVTDNPAVLAFYYPPQLAVTASASSISGVFPNLALISRPGTFTVSSVVEYQTFPPMAAGHPNVNGWMSLVFPISVGACFFNNGVATLPDCLPTGLYTARVHTVVSDGARQADVYANVAMTVVP